MRWQAAGVQNPVAGGRRHVSSQVSPRTRASGDAACGHRAAGTRRAFVPACGSTGLVPGRAVAELSTCYGTTHGAEPLSRQCCPGDKRTGQDRFGLVCAALPSPGRAPASGPAVGGTGLRGALLPRPSHTGASQGGDGRTPSGRVESTAVGPRCLFSRHVRRGSL